MEQAGAGKFRKGAQSDSSILPPLRTPAVGRDSKNFHSHSHSAQVDYWNGTKMEARQRTMATGSSSPGTNVENKSSQAVTMATKTSGTTRRLLANRSERQPFQLRSFSADEICHMYESLRTLSTSQSSEHGSGRTLALNKRETDTLESSSQSAFQVDPCVVASSAVSNGAIFSFSNDDSFGGHSASPHRHRKKHHKRKKGNVNSNSVHPVDVSSRQLTFEAKHLDTLKSSKLMLLSTDEVLNHRQAANKLLPLDSGVTTAADRSKGKHQEFLAVEQSHKRLLSSLGKDAESIISYTPGTCGPLSGSLQHTPVMNTSQLFDKSSLLTPISTRSVRSVSEFEYSDSQLVRQYFPDMMLKIFIGTWNMHEQKEVADNLDDFVLPSNVETLQDLYVIGVQETYMDRHDWNVKLQETLGSSHVLAYSCRQGCLQLSVFIRRDLIWFCCGFVDSNVITTFKPASLIKTKGGLAVACTIFGTSMLFINSHLSAHEEKMLVRHTEVAKVCQSLTIPKGGAYGHTADVTYRYDCVFWFGDLNYRCEAERREMDRLLSEGDIQGALTKDQLAREMKKGNVFNGFSEQPIRFLPTYKYNLNSDIYDTSEKSRTQSWTDRILFKSRYGSTITGHLYQSCDTISSSDHRPVCAMFQAMLQATGENSLPNAPVQFDRAVYSEGNARRRARHISSSSSQASSCDNSKSAVCVIL